MDSSDGAWDRLTDAIDLKFGIIHHGRTNEPLPDRADLTQKIQFITFEKDGAEYKAERVEAPAIIDRKSHYHKAAGQASHFENIYDDSELSHRTNFYRKEGEGWTPIEPQELAL